MKMQMHENKTFEQFYTKVCLMHVRTGCLILNMPWKIGADNILFKFTWLFFQENRTWHFMWIFC